MINKNLGLLFLAVLSSTVVNAFDTKQRTVTYTNNYGASKKYFFTIDDQLTQTRHVDRSISVPRSDVDLALGGRVRQEGLFFDKTQTLRADYNDRYGFNRSKLNLDFRSQYGRRAFGKPAAEMHLRMTAFSVWDDATLYTPYEDEEISFAAGNHLKEAVISEHKHRGAVPYMYLDEGWVKVNFDAFVPALPIDVSLQVGHFPFIVGRGIALGDYFDGAIKYLGFDTHENKGNATQRPPGLLFSVQPFENTWVEFYYTKWRSFSHGPDFTRKETRARRLDINDRDKPENIQRGTGIDRDLYALRLGFTKTVSDDNKSSFYVEPYAVHMRAPEMKIEFDGDAQANITTVGAMVEYNYHNFSCNFEGALQFGKQTVHPIDRNRLIVDDAYYYETHGSFVPPIGEITDDTKPKMEANASGGRLDKRMGMPTKYYSHVLLGFTPTGTDLPEGAEKDTSEYLPYRSYYVADELTDVVNAGQNRKLEAQGAQLKTANGATHVSGAFDSDIGSGSTRRHLFGSYVFRPDIAYYKAAANLLNDTPDGSLFNANIPFGGGQRFRKGYDVTYKGIMLMADVSYLSDNRRFKLSGAVAHISGDEYPFNTEEDKEYHGFVPFRDANYVGRGVTSFAVLYCRKLPRPTDFVDTKLFAENNFESIGNLQYVGVGLQYHPLQEREKLMLETNIIQFFMHQPPHQWDMSARRTFDESGTKLADIYDHMQREEVLFKGHKASKLASKNLGLEINGVARWNPFDNIEAALRAGCFIPGSLYVQTKGMPNRNTVRVNKDGKKLHDSLGDETAWGVMLRLTYKF